MKQLAIKIVSATAVIGLAGGLTALTSAPMTTRGEPPPGSNDCRWAGGGNNAAPGGPTDDEQTQLPAEVTLRSPSNDGV